MNDSVSRTLIQTYVRSRLRELKRSPRRSVRNLNVRNLVDMALQFSSGRFQKSFFTTAQTMLRNDRSAYFSFAQNLIRSVTEERLMSFGMNLGYNSFTAGAKKIRAAEAAGEFGIPWCIYLVADGAPGREQADAYASVIEQGKKLGIYTWSIFAGENAASFLPLIERQSDCAFLLFCSPDDVTGDFLERASLSPHMMPVVRYTAGAAGACRLLREKEFLYSVFVSYRENDVPAITGGKLLSELEPLHPAVMFLGSDACPEQLQRHVGDYAVRSRENMTHPTVVFDLRSDSLRINRIISPNGCTACFDGEGYLHSDSFPGKKSAKSFFTDSLSEIFRDAFPEPAKLKE